VVPTCGAAVVVTLGARVAAVETAVIATVGGTVDTEADAGSVVAALGPHCTALVNGQDGSSTA
jgi:hypothetical protein